jgi:ER membrane protein complex subunit 1
LDPRRPEGQITQEEFAEGLVQYTPILPQHPGAYINYYNLVHRLRAFVTSPAALESTSLVLAYGLDMFYAPIAPNNRYYDRLSHGFSTAIIFIMIAGLTVITWVFMKLYRQKELKKAWK